MHTGSSCSQSVLEMPDGKNQHFRNNRQKAIWEDAKLRGVDFRATGNEPGWFLEVSQENQILLVTDYGQRRFEFTVGQPSVDQASRTTSYHAQKNQLQLTITITIEGRECVDSMIGQRFQTSVMVVLDGKEYYGCGQALH